MTEREALLRAIRANPDDDLVRLVFADWLDERGEHDQAEFIRLQCELEPARHRLEDRRTRELIRREEVLESYRFGAALDYDAELARHAEKIGYRRGLPDWLIISLDGLLDRGDRFFATYPTIRELAVFDVAGRGADLAACELLARLDVLEVADSLTPDDAEALAASPHIRPVGQFKLYGGWDYDCGLGARIAQRSTPDWPRRMEMIWLTDGLIAGIDAADCDQPIDLEQASWAHPVNLVAGRELAHDVRPVRRLFPLRGWDFDADESTLGMDMGRHIYVGHLPGGIQALFAYGLEEWYLVTFEANGIVTAVQRQDCPIPGATWDNFAQVEEAARRWATETLQMVPAVIRVREFEGGNYLGVHLWPRSFDDYFGSRPPPGRPNSRWRERGGTISSWLRKQDFVIDWGSDYWADWKGTIHTS